MFRTAFRVLLGAASFVLFSFFVCAQNGPPADPSRPKLVGPAEWKPSAQEVFVPYWTLEPGWSTALEMRNNLRQHDLTVTPVLRASTGEEMQLPPVTITPEHVVSISEMPPQLMAELLERSGQLYFASTVSMLKTFLPQLLFGEKAHLSSFISMGKMLGRATRLAASKEYGGSLLPARLII